MRRNRTYVILGIVLMISAFLLFTNIGKYKVISAAQRTLGYMKEQCRWLDECLRENEDENTKEAVKKYAKGLLKGSEPEYKGVLMICDKESVLSSNYVDYQGRPLSDAPFIGAVKEEAKAGELFSVKYYGSTYYGEMDHMGDYDLYVLYPSDAVSWQRWAAVGYVFVVYAFFGLVFMLIRRLDAKDQLKREMACQNSMLLSLSKENQANAEKEEYFERLSVDVRRSVNQIRREVEEGNRCDSNLKKQKEMRKEIWAVSGILLDLISDMVDMDQIQSGAVVLEQRSFDISKLFSQVGKWAGKEARIKGIEYESMPLSGQHWRVYGSPVHVEKILINVVGNAIKDNRGGDRVTLSCREKEADDKKVTFEFTCTDTRTSFRRSEQGLDVARSLTKMMGGQIHFPGENMNKVFCRIDIPFIIDDDPAWDELVKKARHPQTIKGRQILLVEDNELNMEIAEFILQKAGASVIRAWNGKEAVDCFEASDPGEIPVILMDLIMPVMDGYKAAAAIRQMDRSDAKTVTIIALTASNFDEDADKCRLNGMDEHLPKPLDARNLIRVIERYLNAENKGPKE